MNDETEIASNFTVGQYKAIESKLDPGIPETPAWNEILKVFRRRIHERFLLPIRELERHDKRPKDERPYRAGFAILALDCLLIDTIQSFREGRVSTGELSSAKSFKNFLKQSPFFKDFKSDDRSEFFNDVRNGLFHNGETRRNWRVKIKTKLLLEKDKDSDTRTINRRLFHCGVIREYRRLLIDFKFSPDIREKLKLRMDALCGIRMDPQRYFAYGSNLLEEEIKKTALSAEPEGIAFLPRYALEFTKHSISRSGDAANIRSHDVRMVWGVVYKVTEDDKKALTDREKGYKEIPVKVFLEQGSTVTPRDAFTFKATDRCETACGPSEDYLNLVIRGAETAGRKLPEEYVSELRAMKQEH